MSIAMPLAAEKFQDPSVTADGKARAQVKMTKLRTLWINTGTLCNLTCHNCYIESSPTNDRLAYISFDEAVSYLDEIVAGDLGTTEIGFTGGEPFMNPDFLDMLEETLKRGFKAMVLTNAMKPMMKVADRFAVIGFQYSGALAIRVSLDHYTKEGHETVRGPRSWEPTVKGLLWLSDNGFSINIAHRTYIDEEEAKVRQGYQQLFEQLGLSVNADDPVELVLFPEMDASLDVPEITTECWGILDVDPESVMCASSRMVVKRKGSSNPAVLACTLIPYDEAFEYGPRLRNAMTPIPLNHPHCARFCVLGGAVCSQG